jgi:hypothetical protein
MGFSASLLINTKWFFKNVSMFTSFYRRCQEFAKYYYIVAIKKAGTWGCRGGDNLHYLKNRENTDI